MLSLLTRISLQSVVRKAYMWLVVCEPLAVRDLRIYDQALQGMYRIIEIAMA